MLVEPKDGTSRMGVCFTLDGFRNVASLEAIEIFKFLFEDNGLVKEPRVRDSGLILVRLTGYLENRLCLLLTLYENLVKPSRWVVGIRRVELFNQALVA